MRKSTVLPTKRTGNSNNYIYVNSSLLIPPPKFAVVQLLLSLVGNYFSLQKIDKDCILVTFDAVSLFTSIPVSKPTKIARRKLTADVYHFNATYLDNKKEYYMRGFG